MIAVLPRPRPTAPLHIRPTDDTHTYTQPINFPVISRISYLAVVKYFFLFLLYNIKNMAI